MKSAEKSQSKDIEVMRVLDSTQWNITSIVSYLKIVYYRVN